MASRKPGETPLIMGIDPGTLATGYGVITNQPVPTPVDHGTIKINRSLPIEQRLHQIHAALASIIDHHLPTVIAVEEPFLGKNVKSAIAVGQAQAIAFLAAASRGIPVHKYSPRTVKIQVTNTGAADKKQVRDLVAATLEISDLPLEDAADALAVALCHIGAQKEATLLQALHQPTEVKTPSRTRPSRKSR